MKNIPTTALKPIRSFRSTLPLIATTALFAIVGSVNAGTTIFEDQMDYANTTELRTSWSNLSSAPNLWSTMSFDPTPLNTLTPTPASGNFMSLGNGVAYRDLGQTVTQDWTLSAKVLFSSYQRGLRVVLLDAAGEKGYGFAWASQAPDQYSGNGSIKITKFDDSGYTDWSSFNGFTDYGTTGSDHAVTGYDVLATSGGSQDDATYNTSSWDDMATVTLSWESSSGLLTLSVDGEEMATHTDTEFSSFSSIYLKGNTYAYFDDISVTAIPEPLSTASSIAVCCLLLLVTKRLIRRSRHDSNQ
ncbi:MAG: hypothetical protein ACQKBU_01345 [Verrucomicrobiales bacterium]